MDPSPKLPDLQIRVKRLPHSAGLPLPVAATGGAAGSDLRAAVDDPVVIEPGAHVAVPTGLCFELPPGTEAQIRPRSGLARKHGVTVLNSPGTVDCDYRGEIQILLINHGKEPVTIRRGERVAQMVLSRLVDFVFKETGELGETTRGDGGWGSSGRG